LIPQGNFMVACTDARTSAALGAKFSTRLNRIGASMHAEFLVLRFVHILSAITWLGGGILTAFFLIPAISGSQTAMAEVMAGLKRKRFFIFQPIVATLTILSGLRLLWIDSAGFAGSYFDSATGKAFSWGGLSAIIAYIISYAIAFPLNTRAAKIGALLRDGGARQDREQLTRSLNRLRRRATIATLATVSFGILAASAMAVARYL
jgi:uncharacterized membrane protein